MPKRKPEEKISYYENKIKLLKEKSNKRRKRLIVYSSSSDSENSQDGTPQDDVGSNSNENTEEANLVISPDTKTDESSELNPELLMALGDPADEQPTYGENIHQSLVQRFDPILKKGLLKEVKEKMLKVYNVPENCKLLKAPTLNPEISAALSETTRNRDKNINLKQDQLGIGITAVSRAITCLLLSDDKLKAVKILTDGCRVLSDLHHTETEVRKKLIIPCLDKSIISMIKEQDRDETLFGKTLSETIKASKAIDRQGKQIKKPLLQRTTSSLPGTSYSASTSISRARFQGNAMGSPRYLSANRGGRGGPARAPPRTYGRTAATATTSTNSRPTTSPYSRHRASNRQ